MANWFVVEQIGPHRSLTPEGFLICHDVPIARTGVQLYGPGETPLDTGDQDYVKIERDPEEVFRDATIASFQGKPIVIEHPVDSDGSRADITPETWRDLVVGHVINPRRGSGIDDDVLLADLLIWDKAAIALINDGKREVSCGYSADYEELGPYHGRQVDIVGNHLALVDSGRCGPRCSIGDEEPCELEPPQEDTTMAARTSLAEKIRAAFRSQDRAALDAALAESEDGKEDGHATADGHHVHVHVDQARNEPPALRSRARSRARDEGEVLPAAIDQPLEEEREGGVAHVIARHDDELEELWEANEMEREAIESLMNAGDGAPKFRDSFPHRDARRRRMGIDARRKAKDQPPWEKEEKEDEDKTEDEGTGQPEWEMEAPPGTLDKARRARDSAFMEPSFDETLAWAEILVPGIRLPTFDAKARPRATFNALCEFRARVLDMAYAAPEGREIIDGLALNFTTGKKLPCEQAKLLLKQAAFVKGRMVSAASSARAFDTMGTTGYPTIVGGIADVADYQRRIDEYYKRQS